MSDEEQELLEDDAAEIEEEDLEDENGEGETEGEAPEGETGEEPDDDPEESGIIEVSLEDEGEKPSAPFRILRKQNRELHARIKELESRQATSQPALGPKPQLKDFDYDETRFGEALDKWHSAKRKEDDAKAALEAEAEKRREAYQKKLTRYAESKAALNAKGFEAAEEVVIDTLSNVQQSIIVAHAKRPEILVYALGKNEKVLAELAEITDPTEFAYRLASVESNLKVTGSRKPSPERKLNGGKSAAPRSGDKTLDSLREEAAKTGDYTKVNAHKRKLKEARA